MITLVLPGDLNTFTKASRVAKVPVTMFQSLIMSQPSQVPNTNAAYTCLVLKARRIAKTGGKTERIP
jgi:hypothetical protein